MPSKAQPKPAQAFETEDVALADLKPHPRNYQGHPQDELEHIKTSIKEHGIFRNVVIAQDGTLLAGHGVCEAAKQLGLTHIPVRRLPYAPDDPRALKVLIADNEIRHLAERDDRVLTELLRDLAEQDELLGTGYDELMVANLLLVTRPASEIEDMDAASQWVGMPEYDREDAPGQNQITVHFATDADREDFARRLDLDPATLHGKKTMWFPEREKDDVQTVRFTDEDEDDE